MCRANLSGTEISLLCDRAAVAASQTKGVPLDVLKAIARTETGRLERSELRPWPWTVNMEGAGRWFETEDQARAFVFSHFKDGARSFDVGCFQINYRWHGAAFRSIDDMFDPVLNAEYAAGFLLKLYSEFGDWSAAAGAYHSRTPEHATAYTEKFETIRSRVSKTGNPRKRAVRATQRQLSDHVFDLSQPGAQPLVGSGASVLGSLVPTVGIEAIAPRAFVVME